MRRRFQTWAALLALAAAGLLPARAQDERADESADTHSAAYAKLAAMEGKTAPDFNFVTRDGTTHSLSEYRGRWVFLEFGYTACPASEWVAASLSHIAAELHGQPFEFVEVYSDPTWDDVDLGVHYDFTGTQALERPGPDGAPDDYNPGFVPACYLVNPRGRIVWAVGSQPEARLRAGLREKIGSGLRFPEGFLSLSSYRERQETAESAPTFAEAEPLWRTLAAEKPDDLLDLLPLGRGLKRKAALDFLDQQLAAQGEADTRLRWHLLAVRALRTAEGDDYAAAAPLYRQLLGKYPASVRLQRGLLALGTAPENFTAADLSLMEGARWNSADFFALAAGAYAMEAHGRAKDGLLLLADFSGWSVVHPLGLLARQGRRDLALALAAKRDGDATPAAATRDQSFASMWTHLAAQDWAGASQFAARHFALTPQNAGGPTARLFCALRLHDDAARDEALAVLANFKTDRPAYLFAQQVQKGEAEATAETLAPFADNPHREVALLWIVAALDAAGKTDQAVAACTLALGLHKPLDSGYAEFSSLRAALHPPPPASAPAAPGPS